MKPNERYKKSFMFVHIRTMVMVFVSWTQDHFKHVLNRNLKYLQNSLKIFF